MKGAIIMRRYYVEKKKSSELDKQKKFFSVYKILPVILAYTVLGLFIIWGVIDACVNKVLVPTSFFYEDATYLYGVMQLKNGFLAWLVWFAIGLVASAFTFFISKIVASHKLLQIYYLQKIAGEKEKVLDDTTE